MSTAIPPMPAEIAPAPGLSEPQRIINTYVAPSKTFEDIRRNARWWVPWLLSAIVTLATTYVVVNKVDFEQMVRQQIQNSSRAAQFESLPKDQQERQIAIGAKIGKVFAFFTPVFSIIGALIIAALMMATFNFIFEARIDFKAALAVVFYSWLPLIVYSLLAIVTLLVRSDTEGINPRNMVATNLGYFIDPNAGSKFVYGMASSLDLFSIWVIILLGMGFAINSGDRKKVSVGAAIATVAAWFIVYRLTFSALGWV